MSDICTTLGQRLRNRRTQLHLSQERLAEICGFHPSYIGQVERGEKNLTVESLERLVVGLGISYEDLFGHLVPGRPSVNYASQCYRMVDSLSLRDQQRITEILRQILELNQ